MRLQVCALVAQFWARWRSKVELTKPEQHFAEQLQEDEPRGGLAISELCSSGANASDATQPHRDIVAPAEVGSALESNMTELTRPPVTQADAHQ